MSNNRPEWNFVDFAAQQVAMPSVPIFPTVGSRLLKFILSHSEAKVVFISDKGIYTKLQSIQKDLPNLKHIYSFNLIDGVKHLSELIELGKRITIKRILMQLKRALLKMICSLFCIHQVQPVIQRA